MAKANFLLQAITKQHHVTAIEDMVTLPAPTNCVFSVAFVRTAGIATIEASLNKLVIKPKVFVGIRNDITSIQAIKRLLSLGVELYTVDTGCRRPIFHPKLYVVSSQVAAKVIIGSANLTHYGLQNNIEASALLELDLSSKDDANFLHQIFSSLEALPKSHPKHVERISTMAQAEKLFAEGRLCDEEVVVAPSSAQQAPNNGGAQLSRMSLFHVARPPKIKAPQIKLAATAKKAIKKLSKTQFVRVWQSKPLSARDLSVPDAKNTNLTGSIGFKQDLNEDFDFQTHFRQVIFANAPWKPIKKTPYKEDAIVSFEFLIENIDFGQFDLRIAHDNRTNTKSYLQRNFMTQLHWGMARPIIARRDLIGRTLMLYQKNSNPPNYLIEID
jgi:HKD family nuclease